MPSTTCAYCKNITHVTPVWAEFLLGRREANILQGAATCDHCGRASIGYRALSADESATGVNDKFARSANLRWFPRTGVSPEFPDVPQHIARAATEAHEAHSINALMAAILMARTVVEATAKEHGIKTGTLFSKIDAMKDAELIRKSTSEAAHEIRHFGNDMAHGDIAELPSTEDAAEVLELMDEVLNEVFQGPAKTKRIKDKRRAVVAPENDEGVGIGNGGSMPI